MKKIQNLGPLRICFYGDDSIKYINHNLTDDVDKDSVVVLGLYKDHFFIDEEIDVSEYWI